MDSARAVGLAGAGEVTAIGDAGFLRTHEAFAGKLITTTMTPGNDDHGTMMAAGDSPQGVRGRGPSGAGAVHAEHCGNVAGCSDQAIVIGMTWTF